ncbi:AMP-binding enzyme [Cordyceps javanica]|uniref:AMP-binding enzyme n=1 Tax=Cordyceps javanica TaxID=43265 RepID=A0A545W4M2_9HYPO|nr:AMP-binding enzyme [Cordyceps javanica]TQW08949.1 AMP-binding enzyme [Cordyceps javanica]
MSSGKRSSNAGRSSSGSSRTPLPSLRGSTPSQATPASSAQRPSQRPAQHPPQHQPSSYTRPLRPLAPKPRAPSSPPPLYQSDDDEPVIDRVSLIWPAESPPERPRPGSPQLPPPIAPTSPTQQWSPQPPSTPHALPSLFGDSGPWLDQLPSTIAPSLLSLTPEQREAAAPRAAADQAVPAPTHVCPPSPLLPRQSGARRGRPPNERPSSKLGQPLRAIAPRPSPSSSPPSQSVEPSPSPRSPPVRPHLYPSLAVPRPLSGPSTSAPRADITSRITQALPRLHVGQHPFWSSGAQELVPCDVEGTIRAAYKHERIGEIEALRRRVDPPYWTVRHIQEVCADVHRMPRAARAGFGDLHKQLRELYDLHVQLTRLYPPPWARPDDVVTVVSAGSGGSLGVTTSLPRVLRDFVGGMSEYLLAEWRPFARARPEWNVDSTIAFFEDFSCFLRFHNKFFGQQVILMHAPQAPGWEDQGGLRFYQSIPFRGFQERLDNGVTSEERARDSFVDCFWDT